jgi:uncharacterized protein (DUF433 family)
MEALDPGVVGANVIGGPPARPASLRVDSSPTSPDRSRSTGPGRLLTTRGYHLAGLAFPFGRRHHADKPLSCAKRAPRFAADLLKGTGQPGRVIVGRGGAACHTSRVSVTILDREMYTEAAAARLLRVAPSTLHWWLEGRPPRYRPVIRVEPTSSRNVTWAEFVEAGLLRSYRREHDVPLKELREFIDRLREEFQVPYPLADRRPYVGSGRRLLIDLQDRSHLDPEFCLVAIANGQTVLTAPGEEFFERVDWSGDQPAGWRPHEDPASPIRINPLVRFGMPAIGGISTEAIAGELEGGASLEEAAEDFGLDLDAVRWAQSYELSQRAAV